MKDLEPKIISRLFSEQLKKLPVVAKIELRGGKRLWVKQFNH